MKLGKSKLALAKVINENGGWPQDSEWAVQNGDHGRISFSINKPVRHDGKSWMTNGGFNFKIEVCKPLKNWHQNVLSREEYYQAYPMTDDDGWIEWKGGECPVDGESIVDVEFNSGNIVSGVAKGLSWRHEWKYSNVIAYRLHKPEVKPEVKPELCESVMRSIPDPESKPTIEHLAQDYRNKLDFAKRKQQEADDAKVAADAALGELELAGEALGLLIGIAKPDPELAITEWRDLRVNDVIFVGEYDDCESGEYVVIELEDRDYGGGYAVKAAGIDGNGRWIDTAREWRFIRRP